MTVRVILNRAFHGHQVNQGAYRQLTAAGVTVHWAPAGQIFHQKTITIDAARALIGTGNLTARYCPDTRYAWIDDRNPAQVHAITATFAADWANAKHSGNAAAATGLMWSPGAQQQMVADIDTARTIARVHFRGADRHQSCRRPGRRRPPRGGLPHRDDRLGAMGGGVHHRYRRGLHRPHLARPPRRPVHPRKADPIDGTSMLIGSQNATRDSLDTNRELFVIVTSPALVKAAAATFGTDYRAASTSPL